MSLKVSMYGCHCMHFLDSVKRKTWKKNIPTKKKYQLILLLLQKLNFFSVHPASESRGGSTCVLNKGTKIILYFIELSMFYSSYTWRSVHSKYFLIQQKHMSLDNFISMCTTAEIFVLHYQSVWCLLSFQLPNCIGNFQRYVWFIFQPTSFVFCTASISQSGKVKNCPRKK